VELTPLPIACAQPRFAARSPRALELLAHEAWLEGCLNEGAAAEEARLAAEDAEGAVSHMLATIARDEHRHAELSWAVLAWLFEVAPATRRAVAGAPVLQPNVIEPPVDRAVVRRGVPASQITAAARSHAETEARVRLRTLAA
ncbi:MAG: hypothetical protein H0V17_24805, partial [Deltaproteobacteria bacterium]|nr:hypothetical protein [Deltaproteobacteria bacterium]